jgi:hypothetical protein
MMMMNSKGFILIEEIALYFSGGTEVQGITDSG